MGAAAGSTLNNGLVSFWKMDETSGTRTDDFGVRDLDTLSATPGNRVGLFGQALDTDGTSTVYLGGTMSGADGNSDFSVSWCTLFDRTGSDEFIAACWQNPNKAWAVQKKATDNQVQVYHSANGTATSGSTTLSAGLTFTTATWYHFVLTYDSAGTSQELWLNGNSIGTHSGAIYTSGSGIGFGGLGNAGSLDGGTDLCGLWNRKLTSAEIAELYATPQNQPF